MRILKDYERAFGQMVNFDKSEASFSGGVNWQRFEELASILSMKQVERQSKYLGVLTTSGRSKGEIFSTMVERIVKKLSGWKEKLLSKAEKEIFSQFSYPGYSNVLNGTVSCSCGHYR